MQGPVVFRVFVLGGDRVCVGGGAEPPSGLWWPPLGGQSPAGPRHGPRPLQATHRVPHGAYGARLLCTVVAFELRAFHPLFCAFVRGSRGSRRACSCTSPECACARGATVHAGRGHGIGL